MPKNVTTEDLVELLDIAEDFRSRGKTENACFLVGFVGRLRRELFPETEQPEG